MTQVLVSVRNLTEAKFASQADIGIIDLKEPDHGALGRVDTSRLLEICDHAGELGRPLSLAMGEADDLTPGCVERLRPILEHFRFAKFGLSKSLKTSGGRNWITHWESLLVGLPPQISGVAVAYADAESCAAPEPEDVVQAGYQIGCEALLIDTYIKTTGQNVVDSLGENRVAELVERAHSLNMFVVLAGSIKIQTIEKALQFSPDFIGVRGGVCEQTRTSSLCLDKLKRFVRSTRSSKCQALKE